MNHLSTEALTPAEVAEVIVERGLAALSASAGSIVLLSPDRSELVLLRAFGYADQIIEPWSRFPADDAVPLADAVRTGDALFLTSPIEADVRFPGLASKRSSGNQVGRTPLWRTRGVVLYVRNFSARA